MGKHAPVAVEGWAFECYEGECEHESPQDCVIGVVACAGCLENVVPDPSDETYAIPEWPCAQSTHYPEPMMSNRKAELLTEWRAKRESANSETGEER